MSERLKRAVITHSVQASLIEQCRARKPYESCGVLFGEVANLVVRADGFAFIRNVAVHPERSFQFDPAEWIQVGCHAQKNQRSIVGFFHSHPYGPHRPSQLDAEGQDVSASMWIADLSRQHEALHVYGFDSGSRPRPLTQEQPEAKPSKPQAQSSWYAIPLTVCAD
ncbi:M67 family metallopeptidase [Cohnella lubricantis]|uniref:M67 family metallopeptidase n=1 Tax=Cohnella lubricantis TaxID=2163172 RepID=A0A841TFI0_9BACL|nr:M67 family metallopeptidase [Cohnella lubricantis]MBB6678845.1 M67 family metallopeptidase [Cohnella lubricantis]MBP2118252.1 proteasome lid subunit RPN8/RPN11 [Cohnella lubricantis]